MKKQKQTNVLVTCGGGISGLTILKSIKGLSGVVSHLFDINEENISRYFFDYFHCSVPILENDLYENELISYCSKHAIDLIVPATQYDLLFLSRRKQLLKKYNCEVAVPDEEFAETFINKRKAQTFLQNKGFKVQEEENGMDKEAYPLIGKPIIGWGGKGIMVANSQEEFEMYRPFTLDYIWNRYIKNFKEYSIDFAVNHNGEVSSPIVRERLSVSGGVSLISQSVSCAESIIDLLKQKFGDPALFGLYNLQFLSTNDQYYFTDLNPRLGTSAVMGDYFDSNPIAHILGNINKEKYPQSINKNISGDIKVIRYLEEKYFSEDRSCTTGDGFTEFWPINNSLKESRTKGFEEGIHEVARRMKKEEIPISEIIRFTGLSFKQVSKI